MTTFKVNPWPRCPSSISSTSESIDHDHTGEASTMNVPRKGPVAEAERSLRRGGWFGATAILAYLASFKLVGHLLTNGNYGYFRDELYYMAAGERLALGYVDFPPFVALITAFTRLLLGDSTVALRFFPAVAGALVVVLAGLMTRELGEGRFAQGLAALAALVAPNFLVMGTFISMDAFDQLFWVSAAFVLILILKQDRPRLWLLFGLIAGLGVLTKITMLYFGFAVFVALLLTSSRKHLLTPWPWLGGAIALVFLLPYVIWQITHGWPTLEFWADYGAKVDPASPIEFLVEQVLTMQPLTLPLWLAGLYYYLFSRDGRTLRPLGLIYVLLFALFAIQNAKFYFLALPTPCSSPRARCPWSVSSGGAAGPGSSPLTRRFCWWEVSRSHPWSCPSSSSRRSRASRAPGSSRSAVRKGSFRSTSPTGSAGRTWWRPLQGSTTRYRWRTAPRPASSPPTTVKGGP